LDNQNKREYIGNELDHFSVALNWKHYWASQITPYVGNYVLEVGAGIGSSTEAYMRVASPGSWLCLEPDEDNYKTLLGKREDGLLPAHYKIKLGTLMDLPAGQRFDSILYIDVLEHIEDDHREMRMARSHLNDGGHLIILAPALQSLYSEFDEAIGHFRRYDHTSFMAISIDQLRLVRLRYLDSLGVFLSLSNRLALRQKLPSKNQLRFWDRMVIPFSIMVDWLLRYKIGRSILAIYRRDIPSKD
jgi:SAM-dependent methyltransferase